MIRRIAATTAFVALAVTAAPLVAQAPAGLKFMELGKGPTIVLVSGLGGARLQWMPTTRKLMTNYRVVMVDIPGHGDSPMPDPFSFDAAAKLLDDLLARQKAESTIVVGHGMGGVLAILAAKQHPEHVRGVVAIDASLKTPFGAVPDQERRYLLEFIDSSPENYSMFVKEMFTRMGRDTTQGREIHAKAALVPPANMKAYIKELAYFDATGAVRDWKLPFLYLASSRAWPDTVKAEQLQKDRGFEAIAGFAPHRIANASFLVMSDQPDSLAVAISEFATRAFAKK